MARMRFEEATLKTRVFLAALLGLQLAAPAAAMAKVKVVASLPDLAAIAREVGGTDVEVTSLALPTQDPHFVDARPSLALPLNRADLLVFNGLELEVGWLPNLVGNARNARIQSGGAGYLDASTVIAVKEAPKERIDRSMGDIHPGGNPHYMLDPLNGARVGGAIARRLAALDPEHATGYTLREQAFRASAGLLAAEEARRFAALPAARRQVVTYHKSLVYLLDWLHVSEVDTLEPKPGIPPSPVHMAEVLGRMRSAGAHVIVQEDYYPATTGQQLAEKVPARLVVIPGGTHAGQTYLAHVREVAEKLRAGLAE